ncbi:MAG: YycH family regulatory protein [Bacillus sp. (in: firmicutes)]
MNKETIKTIILTFLVGSSLFLTWNIWTYSPNVDPIDQSSYISEVAISNKKQISEIIKPSQVMLHDEPEHYGGTSDQATDLVLNEMYKWTFYNFKDISNSISSQNFESFIHKSGTVELVFSDTVPFSLYKQVINVEDREIRRDMEFDRILLAPSDKDMEENNVYFISTEGKQIYKFSVNAVPVKNVASRMYGEKKNLQPYKLLTITDYRYLYVPSEKLELDKYKYYAELLDVNKFKKALFPDPSLVKLDKITRGQEFTDGATIMNVYDDTMILKYVNPSLKKSYPTDSSDLLKRSIDFINEHSGWEDNYRFAELSVEEQKTTFRLYLNGLPIYNEQGMSELVQYWAGDELNRYNRPFFTLDFALDSENQTVSLPTGEEAFDLIKKNKDFQVELLDNMTIGYKMNKDLTESQSIFISLEPSWFYKYDGEWKQLITEQTGGMQYGLE